MLRVIVFAVLGCCGASLVQAEVASEVALKRGQIEISADDLRFYARDRVPTARRGEFFRRDEAVKQLADSLVAIRVLAAEAADSGVVDTDLIEWQLSLHRERLMMEQYLDALVASQTADIDWESTAKDVYTAEADAFQQPERVRAAHILIKTEDRSEEEALALAKEALQKLEAGEDFKMLALKYSEDPSAKTNLGSLGTFARGQMVPEFEQAAFALRKAGELAGPVKTDFGYHIIKLDEYLPARRQSFDEVKAEIISKLQSEIPANIRQSKLVEIRSAEPLEFNEEVVQQLLEEFREASSR
ncbi:MAG: peptidylprolyl isomerase [Haliea sp.]|uniref:peptidylprolyl isomerase n=1 Tax=Haliea sp. TaxID=1932666 RepID=UPI0032F05CD8